MKKFAVHFLSIFYMEILFVTMNFSSDLRIIDDWRLSDLEEL